MHLISFCKLHSWNWSLILKENPIGTSADKEEEADQILKTGEPIDSADPIKNLRESSGD